MLRDAPGLVGDVAAGPRSHPQHHSGLHARSGRARGVERAPLRGTRSRPRPPGHRSGASAAHWRPVGRAERIRGSGQGVPPAVRAGWRAALGRRAQRRVAPDALGALPRVPAVAGVGGDDDGRPVSAASLVTMPSRLPVCSRPRFPSPVAVQGDGGHGLAGRELGCGAGAEPGGVVEAFLVGAGPKELVRGGVFDDQDGGVVSGRPADVGEQVVMDPVQQIVGACGGEGRHPLGERIERSGR